MRRPLRWIAVATFALSLLPSSADASQTRTWQFVLNKANGGNGNATNLANYHLWFTTRIVLGDATALTWVNQANGAVASPTGVWTLSQSSVCLNSTPGHATGACTGGTQTLNTTGTDNLGSTFDTDKWVHAAAASNHTWLIFTSVSVAGVANTNYKFWIDCNSATVNVCAIGFGYGAITNGTATAVATVATPFQGTNMSTLQWDDGTTANHKVHGMLSTGGDFWIYQSKDGSGYFWSAFGAVGMTNQPSWMTSPTAYPLWTTARYSATSPVLAVTSANIAPGVGGANAMSRRPGAASNTRIGLVLLDSAASGLIQGSGVGSSDNVTEPDPSGNALMVPCNVWIYDSTGGFARNDYAGTIPDLYMADTLRTNGDVTPNGGNIDYTIVGNMWAPWGTTTAPSL